LRLTSGLLHNNSHPPLPTRREFLSGTAAMVLTARPLSAQEVPKRIISTAPGSPRLIGGLNLVRAIRQRRPSEEM
jgi:hypothetical protein